MNKHPSGSLQIAAVVNNATHLAPRWPIAWTILLVLVLSAGLWSAIFVGARAAIAFLTQI